MNNRDYWRKREDEALKHYIKQESEYDKEIKRIYQSQLDAIQKEIDGFYGRYAAREGITLAEAKKRVSKADIEAYGRKAAKYVKDKDFSARANEEMRLYNATMRINRLEMLKANIGLELIAGHDELEKFMGGILKGRTEEELKRQAGILGKSVRNNAQKANAIPNASFHNATFSDRIWMYQDAMKADLSKLLQSGLIQGKNSRLLARELQKNFNASTANAERLMRTELARVQTESQKQSFIRNGFEEYEYIANSGCCDVCQGLDGKHFKVAKMMPGENAAPMHPNCRCSVAAYEDSEEYEAWLDYLDKGGSTAGWNAHGKAEWKKKNKVLEKSENGATIKVRNISAECQRLLDALNARGVDYRQVEMHGKQPSSSEIIKALAGGDLTDGSCASVGLAYIGQQGGMKVLDFRGGKSRGFFSIKSNLRTISTLPGVKTFVEVARSSVTAGNKLLKNVETGKEYYLVCGRHAAIVRKSDEGALQYLELQSEARSGWTNFDGNPRYTLKTRFGENKGYDVEDFMFEVDTLKNSDDLMELLGYINTAEGEQRKGKHGSIK